jgi:hypothetical protein
MVETMTRYTAHVVRDGRFWLISIPEIERSTQARHLREIDTMARDLVVVMTGEASEDIDLNISVETPVEVKAHLALAAKFREEARIAQAEAAAELRRAARELKASGMPLRDIGAILDVSYQRAHQLVNS